MNNNVAHMESLLTKRSENDGGTNFASKSQYSSTRDKREVSRMTPMNTR
jgi:hypothetical protein